MKEKGIEVLDKYDINIIKTGKVRGAILLITDEGPMLLKECARAEQRIAFENSIHSLIKDSSEIYSDYIIRNNEGEYITKDANQISYVIKKWYEGNECIPTDRESIYNAVTYLAKLHKILYGKICSVNKTYSNNLIENYERYNRELKRARNFVRTKKHKTDFELQLISEFDAFYSTCEYTLKLLKESDYKDMYSKAMIEGEIIHGDYNYHNIIFMDNMTKAGILNFESANMNLRIVDVYNFLRKVMEKNDWDIELGINIIERYDSVRTISDKEKKLLKIMLMYPEKFRKVVNHYFNGNKSWIPGKNMEKLILVHKQMKLREKFVQYL